MFHICIIYIVTIIYYAIFLSLPHFLKKKNKEEAYSAPCSVLCPGDFPTAM